MPLRTTLGLILTRSFWLIALVIVSLVGACQPRNTSGDKPPLTHVPSTATPAQPTAAPTDIGQGETNGEIAITRPASLAVDQEDVIVVEIRRERFLASLRDPATHQALVVESPSTASARIKAHAELLVFPLMSARLTANTDALDIRSGGAILQSSLDTEYIFWTWQIRAKKPGTHRLTLNIQGQTDNTALLRNVLDHSYFYEVAEEPPLARLGGWLGANAVVLIGMGGGSVLLLAFVGLLITRHSQSISRTAPSLLQAAPDTEQALNFDLAFEHSAVGYRARVLNSPAGEAEVEFTLPFATQLQSDDVPPFPTLDLAAAKALGAQLYDTIFQGDVRGVLQSSLDEAHQRRLSLRLRLRLGDTPALAVLPWEFLYSSRRNAFLSLAEDTPIIRYMDLPGMLTPLTVDLPLRILVVISSPSDYEALDAEHEWEHLNAALQPLFDQRRVTLARTDDAQLDSLRQTLRSTDYHVLHFIGHGEVEPTTHEGVLVLENNVHSGSLISGENLGILLHNFPSVRVVLLNACEGARATQGNPFGGVAQNLVQQGIPAVIAMQTAISDQAATLLAQEFYSAVSVGRPVDAAIASARSAIFNAARSTEWATPVLYLRAPNGLLFAPIPRNRERMGADGV